MPPPFHLARPAPPPPPCLQCGRASNIACEGCHRATYCSSTCQGHDAAQHQLLCDQVGYFRTPPCSGLFPPGNVRRGILFDPAAGAPRFVWVPFELVSTRAEKEARNQYAAAALRVKAFLGPGPGVQYLARPLLGGMSGRSGGGGLETLEIVYRCRENTDSEKGEKQEVREGVNPAVVRVMDEKAARRWRGPVLALKRSGVVSGDDGRVLFDLPYISVGVRDLGAIVDFLRSYRDEEELEEERRKERGDAAADRRSSCVVQ